MPKRDLATRIKELQAKQDKITKKADLQKQIEKAKSDLKKLREK